ncbi:MAG: cytochrome o ubiquinol oxidase subunit IV, partial [Gammaproteobacteria bacterium]|nr:cytochrome o ubiquinol oxidase subunit IV [Gammaproteobacteria bacterium]
MHDANTTQPDYGTGKKKLSVYLMGLIICAILTLIAFSAVMMTSFAKPILYLIIFSAAVIQFLVQVIFFLRLNLQTPQGQTNVMSLIFTGVILTSILAGSLWIMWNVNYYMMN